MTGSPQPLAGQRVLITRPAEQAEALAQLLCDQGAQTVLFPTLEIQPTEHFCATLEPLKHYFLDLDNYQTVIFISSNAATLGHQWIDSYWPQLPVGIDWLAVGDATAKTLQRLGIPARAPASGMDSEALLQLPELSRLDGQRVLICRGVGGREHLENSLRQLGARVDCAELYRRVRPNYADQDIESIIYNFLPSVMLVTSQQTLENLDDLCQGAGKALPIQQLRQTALIVPSERVAQKAEQLGYSKVYRARNATDQAMIDAIRLLLQQDNERGKIHE